MFCSFSLSLSIFWNSTLCFLFVSWVYFCGVLLFFLGMLLYTFVSFSHSNWRKFDFNIFCFPFQCKIDFSGFLEWDVIHVSFHKLQKIQEYAKLRLFLLLWTLYCAFYSCATLIGINFSHFSCYSHNGFICSPVTSCWLFWGHILWFIR